MCIRDRPVPYPVKVPIKVPYKVPYPVEVKVPVHIPVPVKHHYEHYDGGYGSSGIGGGYGDEGGYGGGSSYHHDWLTQVNDWLFFYILCILQHYSSVFLLPLDSFFSTVNIIWCTRNECFV